MRASSKTIESSIDCTHGESSKGWKMVDLVTDAMTESDRDGAQSYVVFRLGGEGYALEVMRVQEVLDVQSMTEVPGSPKCLLGVINLRGHVVPVYDLRIPFGLHTDSNLNRAPSVLIVETEQGNDSQVTRTCRGPCFRRPRVLSGRSATLPAVGTWENDSVRPRADPSPGGFPARIGSGSGLFCPGVVER